MGDTWYTRPDRNIGATKIMSEFTHSRNCCGETSNGALLANRLNGTPSHQQLMAICLRDRAAGLTTSGSDAQTIAQLYADLTHFEGYVGDPNCYLYPYKTHYSTDDLASASRVLIGGIGGIVIEVDQAYKLPYMESGVNAHFIAALAYDSSHSDTHFYVVNPDRTPRPMPENEPYSGDWMTIQQIAAAGIIGMVRLKIVS